MDTAVPRAGRLRQAQGKLFGTAGNMAGATVYLAAMPLGSPGVNRVVVVLVLSDPVVVLAAKPEMLSPWLFEV